MRVSEWLPRGACHPRNEIHSESNPGQENGVRTWPGIYERPIFRAISRLDRACSQFCPGTLSVRKRVRRDRRKDTQQVAGGGLKRGVEGEGTEKNRGRQDRRLDTREPRLACGSVFTRRERDSRVPIPSRRTVGDDFLTNAGV